MAITFAYRSGDANSFDARYSIGRKDGISTIGATNAVDATAIGGRAVVMQNSAIFQNLLYDGYNNMPNNRSIGILLRYAPDYSGVPAGRRAIWAFSNSGATHPGTFQLYHEFTTGALTLHATNETGAICFNFVSLGNWTTNVSGTWYDLVFIWDGTTTANAAKLYIDGTLFGQATAAAALTVSWTNKYRRTMMLGVGETASTFDGKINEFVISDNTTDLVGTVNLESGTGSLDGSSRTSYVSDVAGQTLTSFDGYNNTSPGTANVRNGTTWYFNGVEQTGTLIASPPPAKKMSDSASRHVTKTSSST